MSFLARIKRLWELSSLDVDDNETLNELKAEHDNFTKEKREKRLATIVQDDPFDEFKTDEDNNDNNDKTS